MDDDRIHDLLHAQDGVLSHEQAIKAGMSRHAWRWKLTQGRWQVLLRGVAAAHSGLPTRSQLLWAASLYAGPGAALSGDAALVCQGLKLRDLSQVDVVIPHGRRVAAATLPEDLPVVVRRVRAAAGLSRAGGGVPRLTPHCAVLHAAAWAVDHRAAEWRLAAVVQQRLSAVPNIRAALTDLPRLPRRALIREVLDDIEFGAHAGSELDFLRFCRRHGLPLPDRMHVKVRSGKVHYLDARYDRLGITIEVDGAHHRNAGQWDADALRTLRVMTALPGERVIRVTRGNMRHDEAELAGLLQRVLS